MPGRGVSTASPPLGEGQGAQILLALAQHVVEAHPGRKVAQQFRVRRFAVEPLLQIVERRDRAVAQDQQLAIERHILGHRLEHVREGAADIVARPGIHPLFAAAPDELDADAVPFPFGQVVARIEPAEIALLYGLRQHQRGEYRQVAYARLLGPAFEPVEQGSVGWRQPVPDLFDLCDVGATPFGECCFGEPRRDADTQTAGDEFQQRPAAGRVKRVEPGSEMRADIGPARGLQRRDDLGKMRHAISPHPRRWRGASLPRLRGRVI